MRKTLLTRLAAVAAGGVLALWGATPASAVELPAGTPLKAGHAGQTAESGDWDKKCGADEFNGAEVPAGYDGWHFILPAGEFTALHLKYSGDPDVITIDGDGASGGYTGWIRTAPGANPGKHAYLFTPAGWTLEGGSAEVTGGSPNFFNVSHTCVGTPGDDPDPTPTPTRSGDPGDDPSHDPSYDPSKSPGVPGGEEPENGLPVTGMQVGLLVILGAGMLAAGVAMLAVRRRKSLASLIEG